MLGEFVFHDPRMEKIRDRFAFLALENYVDKPPVVFGVSEPDATVRFPWIEVTEAELQTDKEKVLPIRKLCAFRVYRGAPPIRNLRQAWRSGFQLCQVA